MLHFKQEINYIPIFFTVNKNWKWQLAARNCANKVQKFFKMIVGLLLSKLKTIVIYFPSILSLFFFFAIFNSTLFTYWLMTSCCFFSSGYLIWNRTYLLKALIKGNYSTSCFQFNPICPQSREMTLQW